MEKDLLALLLASASVGAIVGTRITPIAREQGGILPAVTLQRISGGPEYADDGEVGIQGARVQFDCWGDTYASVKDLAIAVTNELSAVQDVTQGATTFIYILLEEERDAGREAGSNADEYLYRVSLDFMVWSNF